MNIVNTAKAYAHSGLSVVPTCADKRPACAWKTYTERIMSDREIETFFGNAGGIGIACGRVSGNLELLDFDDGGSAFESWFCDIPEYLARKLVVETSPSGGKHVYYRVGGGEPGVLALPRDGRARIPAAPYAVPGNRKLAMKPDGHVLIETRGEGGYVKCAPSTGYDLMAGDFCHVPTVSPFEQQIMIDAAVKLDERSAMVGRGVPTAPQPHSNGNCVVESVAAARGLAALPATLTPWDDYNQRGDFAALLEAHGWKRVKAGDNEHWERPGKDAKSTSATWNGTVFYVFSSNAWGFEPNKGYNKFQVFAALECGGDTHEAARRLRGQGFGGGFIETALPKIDSFHCSPSPSTFTSCDDTSPADPGPLPEALLHIPGFVDLLTAHTLDMAPYPNRPLAFAGALSMLAHLTGRNFRDSRNLRTNVYLLALADSGVGKDVIRKVNMNLAAEVGIMPTMADRFASAEGLEDALLIHPASFFQVDEVDTLFAALQEKKDSSIEKIYGALLQFATSSDTTYAMRKKAIQQTSGKACKFDKVRARGIREPHLTLLGCAIPKYLYSALSERAMENGLLSRCLILEAGARGKAGTPHFKEFDPAIIEQARYLVSLGGFEGLDLEKLDDPAYVCSAETAAMPPPYTVAETPEALTRRNEVAAKCEDLYDAAKSTAEKALWTRGAEKTSRLALLYAISENVRDPLVTDAAVDWGWAVVEHLTRRMLYQSSVYVHDNEFDALRQKALRYLRDYGANGALNHGALLRYLHIDSDSFRKVIETLLQSELITVTPITRGGFKYTLV